MLNYEDFVKAVFANEAVYIEDISDEDMDKLIPGYSDRIIDDLNSQYDGRLEIYDTSTICIEDGVISISKGFDLYLDDDSDDDEEDDDSDDDDEDYDEDGEENFRAGMVDIYLDDNLEIESVSGSLD